MAVLALVLILVALVFSLGVLTGNTGPQSLSVFGVDISSTSAGIFLVGAATMLVLLSGVWLLQTGASRARRKRAEVKSLRRNAAAGSAEPSGTGSSRRGRSLLGRDRGADHDSGVESDRV